MGHVGQRRGERRRAEVALACGPGSAAAEASTRREVAVAARWGEQGAGPTCQRDAARERGQMGGDAGGLRGRAARAGAAGLR